MTTTFEPAVDEAPKQESKGKGRRRKQANQQPTEPAPDAQPAADATPAQEPSSPEPERKPRSKRAKKAIQGEGATMTLGELSRRYLEHLKAEDKADGTVFSYGMELKLACRVLNEDTPIALLTPDDVRRFNVSSMVMLLRSGRDKAAPSFLKSRRVLRLALTWAHEQGWIPTLPIPDGPTNA